MKVTRKEFLGGAAALAVAGGNSALAAAAKEPIRGTVRLADGWGLKDVVVSDGLVSVKTDGEGRFTLPAAHDYARFVFVSMPSGHWFPTGAYWQRLVPGKTEGYDFVLEKRKETNAQGGHRFIHFSDSEISGIDAVEERWRDELKSFAAAEDAAFIVHTGDICYRAGLVSHIKLMNTANMGRPVLVLWTLAHRFRAPAGDMALDWHGLAEQGRHRPVAGRLAARPCRREGRGDERKARERRGGFA